jgi:two-component system, cell cycle response regulator CtrA
VIKRCECCGQAVPEFGGIVADDDRSEVRFNGLSIYLTREEFVVFRALLDRPGRVVSKDQFLDALYWNRHGEDEPYAKIVDVFICRIRKKITPAGLEIRTHRGRGFELLPPATDADAAGAANEAQTIWKQKAKGLRG